MTYNEMHIELALLSTQGLPWRPLIFFQFRQSVLSPDVCTSAGILWVDVPEVHFSISSLIMNVSRINNLQKKVILRILEGYFLTTAKASTSVLAGHEWVTSAISAVRLGIRGVVNHEERLARLCQ
jgi:hypothetical protein